MRYRNVGGASSSLKSVYPPLKIVSSSACSIDSEKGLTYGGAFLETAVRIAVLVTISRMVGGKGVVVRIIERVAEHYDEQEVEFGKVYKWCPEGVAVECVCGERFCLCRADILSGSLSTCECGKDNISDIREEVQAEVIGHLLLENEEAVHPWRYWHTSESTGIPF